LPPPATHLALALEQRGDEHAALEAYLDGLRQAPSDPGLRAAVVGFFRRYGLDVAELPRCVRAGTENEDRAIREELRAALAARWPR